MDDSSSIIKSGSADIVGQGKSIGDLRLHDDSSEIVSITPEQIQGIRNGLSTSVQLTEQVVKVIGDGDKLFKKDVKKINDLKRRLKRVIPDGGAIQSLGKVGAKSLSKPADAIGNAAGGALALELLALVADNEEKVKRASLLGGWRDPANIKPKLKPKPKVKPKPKFKGVKNFTAKKRLVKLKRFFTRKKKLSKPNLNNPLVRKNLLKPKSTSLINKSKGIVPKTSIVNGNLQSSSPGKAPAIPKNKLVPPKKSILSKLKKLKIGQKANVALTVGFSVWEFMDRRSDKDGDGVPDQTILQAGAGTGAGVAGGIAGASTGAMAGAAVGSVVPIVGTAIGGIVGGLIGGVLGSMAASKLSDDITGVNDKNKDVIEAIKKETNVNSLNKDTTGPTDTVVIITGDG